MLVFGFLAGGVYAFGLRRQLPPAGRWILASSLAGFVAAGISLLSTGLAETSVGLLAGWAYAWAVYGAVYGAMLQRITPDRRLMLVSLVGWAAAGIVSAAVGWGLDVLQVVPTDPSLTRLPPTSRTWSMGGLAVLGTVCGATGAAITAAALVLRSRVSVLPRAHGVSRAKDTRLVNVAGVICGLLAAALCTSVAPLVGAAVAPGPLDPSVDPTIFFCNFLAGTPVCVPAVAVVSIPLAIGCGHIGLEIGRAKGSPHSRPWVWLGAAVGGVAGILLSLLAVFAVSDMAA
jgi:hypothetical protein